MRTTKGMMIRGEAVRTVVVVRQSPVSLQVVRFGSLESWRSDVEKFVSEWDEFGRAERFSEKVRGHGVGV